MRKIWLVPDTHFNHRQLEKWGRPANFEEHIFKGLNDIYPYDLVIHMGDFCIGDESKWFLKYIGFMPQMKHMLIRGNHDKRSVSYYLDQGFGAVTDGLLLKIYGKNLLITHQPVAKAQSGNADFNIHAHTHGNLHRFKETEEFYDPGFNIEIALENSSYHPVLLNEKLLKRGKI